MEPVKQPAIVLGGVNYSDSSRVLWVLTPAYGRQSLMVKGARRAKSKFQGMLDTFNLLSVIYRKTQAGSIYTLREADVTEHFAGLRQNLEAFWAASQAVELIKAVSGEEEESGELFGLLWRLLGLLSAASVEDRELPNRLLQAFRWRLAALAGTTPRLTECVACGRKLTRRPRYRFLMAQAGVLCHECGEAPGSGEGLGLSYQALRFIYRATRLFPEDPAELPPLDHEGCEELERLSRRFLAYHLGDHPAFIPTVGGRHSDRPED